MAVASVNQLATNNVATIKSGVNIGSTGIAIATSANPVGAVVTAAGGLINIFSNLNHPFGACAPNAKSMDEFLACWQHVIPDNTFPAYGEPATTYSKTKGWGFGWCPGAVKGRAPSEGCRKGCDCSGRPCICIPTGAVMALTDGTFLDSQGRNLGPATVKSGDGIESIVSPQLAPLDPVFLGRAGVSLPNGSVVPYSSQQSKTLVSTMGGVGLTQQQASAQTPVNMGLFSGLGGSSGIILLFAAAIAAFLFAFGGKARR